MKKKQKRTPATTGKHILKGLRNALIVDVIVIAVLLTVAFLFAFITGNRIGRSMYMACYYGSIFILLVSIPQFYRRNEAGRLRRIRQMDTMFGFYGWFGNKYNDEVMEKSFDDFKGDGFWLGIMLVIVGAGVLATGVILELLFF